MRMGSRMLRQAALGLKPAMTVHILPRSSIGVEYPAVTSRALPLQPVGLLWTDASFDEARARLADVAMLLARLGEAETALWRLLAEQRKTQKRVNALKYNIIPRLYRDHPLHRVGAGRRRAQHAVPDQGAAGSAPKSDSRTALKCTITLLISSWRMPCLRCMSPWLPLSLAA